MLGKRAGEAVVDAAAEGRSKESRVEEDEGRHVVQFSKDDCQLREAVLSEYPDYCVRARDAIRLFFGA